MKLASGHLDAEARRLLGAPFRELTPEQRQVLVQILRRAPVARDLAAERDERAGFGERLSDDVARVGGSWAFIAAFALFMALWVGVNAVSLGIVRTRPFDPYPFVFLNLILSTLAAVQAPIIIMSQNRQAQRDREAAEHDYTVNLKAELEIMALHEKLEALRTRELADLLAHQVELLQELRERPRSASGRG